MTVDAPSNSYHGRWFWGALAVGAGLAFVGVRYALEGSTGAHWPSATRWTIGLLVAHDAFVFPVVLAGGWVLGRILPRWARGPARSATVLTLLVAVFSWPLVRRYGARPDVPSQLPYASYGTNVLVVIAAVWIVALFVAAQRWRTRARLH